MEEMTLQELAQHTGMSESHLSHLIRRGILPKGRREGRNRILPVAECVAILAAHEPGTHWRKPQGAQAQGSAQAEQNLAWDDLINGAPAANPQPALDWSHLL